MESAGLLLFKRTPEGLRVLLGHMGGPFWAKKDAGAWTIPKGEPLPGEALADAALREFGEELGSRPAGPLVALPPVMQRNGKRVHIWAVEGDLDPSTIVSNTFTLEWPPRSGRMQEFPEIDRAAWWSIAEAERLAVTGQGAAFAALAERFAR